jgi:hypothetical protein
MIALWYAVHPRYMPWLTGGLELGRSSTDFVDGPLLQRVSRRSITRVFFAKADKDNRPGVFWG